MIELQLVCRTRKDAKVKLLKGVDAKVVWDDDLEDSSTSEDEAGVGED